ncbi:MAG: hypothetical protein QM482_09200 [Sulfurospirillum sp.]
MSLLTNSKFISVLWWIFMPVLVALLFNSVILLIFMDRGVKEIKFEQQKTQYIENFPKFLNLNRVRSKRVSPKIKKVENLGAMILQACYASQNKKFIIFKEGSKTIFLDLNQSYKGAKLLDVGLDYAVFSKNGKKIELKLEEIKTKTQAKKGMLQSSGREKYIGVKRDDFKKYTKNIRRALRDVRIQELRKKRKFAGIRLSFIRRGSLFDKMRLKVGDVIKSIDGNELGSMMDLLPYYNRINDTATIQVGFERNNEMKEIIYEIN